MRCPAVTSQVLALRRFPSGSLDLQSGRNGTQSCAPSRIIRMYCLLRMPRVWTRAASCRRTVTIYEDWPVAGFRSRKRSLGSCLLKKSFEALGLQKPLSVVCCAQPRGSPGCIAHCESLESGPALQYLFFLGLEIRCLAITAANPEFLRLGRLDSAWPCRLT
jgi:hypothetical protein